MKILITNYVFNPGSKTITFSDYSSIRLNQMLLVTNVTDNIIIYNFADPEQGGTVLNNVLTLDYNTTTMSSTDSLQIYYDDADIHPSTDESSVSLKSLLQLLKPLGIVTSATGRLSIDVASGSIAISSGTVTTVTTVTTVGNVANQTNMGGLNALDLQFNLAHTAWNTGIRNNITF